MMRHAGARVAAFVALLLVVFAGAALAGAAIDPEGGSGGEQHVAAAEGGGASHEHAATAEGRGTASSGDGAASGSAAGHGAASAAGAGGAGMPAGVASSQDGLRLVAERTRFDADRRAPLTFRILDARNETVHDFETEQARRMHVIVVRRDLRRYQHLHPTQAQDGSWSTPLTLPEAGVYRAFADFTSGGEQRTLGIDLFAPGPFSPEDLPAPSSTARVDGYEVKLHEHPGETGFFVHRAGKLVTDLQPYLGARGHLVALREGDLAYQHIHPDAGPPPEIAFHTGASEPGSYRLFLQFRHEGRVHTAAFTRVVEP
jgi:hypothetical protein